MSSTLADLKLSEITVSTTVADGDLLYLSAVGDLDRAMTRADLVGSETLTMESGKDIILVATDSIIFDGVGGHTSIAEVSDNKVDIITGGSASLGIAVLDVGIRNGASFFFDGTALTGNTLIHQESSDDLEIITGGQIAHKMEEIGTEVNNVFGALNVLSNTATDGFVYIPTVAGVPTGVPTAYTGKVAIQFDTTNNDLYVYDGSWIKVALA